MTIHRETFSKLEHMLTKAELIENLMQRIQLMEQEVSKLKDVDENKWITLKEAAQRLCKTPTAVRQKIKNPKNMMAENVVWKQKSAGAEILVNLKKYRKCL